MEVRKLDFVGVPSRDTKRLRQFYVDTLGLQPDKHPEAEFWVGDTCLVLLHHRFAPYADGSRS